jgi:hypothetical protein
MPKIRFQSLELPPSCRFSLASNSSVIDSVTWKKRTFGARGHALRGGQARLARPTGTDEQHILTAVDVLSLHSI